MPVYEYVCNACGYTFERIQSFNDDPVSRCPSCKGTVRRVISSVSVIFKGSGWYITDNRRQISSRSGSTAQLGDPEGDKVPNLLADGDKSAAAGDGPSKDKSAGKGSDESGHKGKERGEHSHKDTGRGESGQDEKKLSQSKKGTSTRPSD